MFCWGIHAQGFIELKFMVFGLTYKISKNSNFERYDKLCWHILCIFFGMDANYIESTLVRVSAWCLQASSHYLNQRGPGFMSLYGITRLQGVIIYAVLNDNFFLLNKCKLLNKVTFYIYLKRTIIASHNSFCDKDNWQCVFKCYFSSEVIRKNESCFNLSKWCNVDTALPQLNFYDMYWLDRKPLDESDGLVQERHNSIADALELRLSCTNLSILSLNADSLSPQGDKMIVRGSCEMYLLLFRLPWSV